MLEDLKAKQPGELNAAEAVKFFDGITDASGAKLVQSLKRAQLRMLFIRLYNSPQQNVCTLKNGTNVPIIVKRRDAGRAAAYYLNTPSSEIMPAFANAVGIRYRGKTRPQNKQSGDLIAAEVKHLFDNITVAGKKISGAKKQNELQKLFFELWQNPKQNLFYNAQNELLPIVVQRLGINNKIAYCLNAGSDRHAALSAFAAWSGCDYLEEKENAVNPPAKQSGELTSRECARIFHKVENRNPNTFLKYAAERLADWFKYIYNTPHLNKVILPDKTEVPLVVYRQSMSQKCFCLNTSDEIAKPFVIKKMAELSGADVCFFNLKIAPQTKSSLYKAIVAVAKAECCAVSKEDKDYYHAYAQKAYQILSPQSKQLTIGEWLAEVKAQTPGK